MKKAAITSAIIVLILVLGYVGLQSVPKPISSDLSLLDEKKFAVVLAYENYSPSGGDALNRLKRIRADFESQVNFIVADLGTPQGRAIADRYRIYDSQAVLLTQRKQVAAIIGLEASDEEFRRVLQAELARSQ